jgi:hypothetical protein
MVGSSPRTTGLAARACPIGGTASVSFTFARSVGVTNQLTINRLVRFTGEREVRVTTPSQTRARAARRRLAAVEK